MIGVGEQDDFGSGFVDTGGLPDHAVCIQNRLRSRKPVSGAPVDQNALPYGIQVDLQYACRQGSYGFPRRCVE